jgi:hypothetical protein
MNRNKILKHKKKIVLRSFIFVILSLIAYLNFFSHIEPSVNFLKEKDLDLELWNADGDLSNIEYYFILDKNRKSLSINRNEAGIFYHLTKSYDDKKYVLDTAKDTVYIPTDMSGQIILNYNQFQITKDEKLLADIDLMKSWLIDNVHYGDSLAYWPHPMGFNKYDLKIGWTGAWAIGNQLSALARLYQIEPSEKILTLTRLVINNLRTEIKNGGITAYDKNGYMWFEEYPSMPKSSVLNGHINALFGLYDVWRVTSDQNIKSLFDLGLMTVESNLDKYDAGYWSYYDQKYNYVCDYKYHNGVHIPQLKILYQITGKEIFKEYYEKWESYNNEPYFSFAKIKMLLDAFSRRLKYKSILTRG